MNKQYDMVKEFQEKFNHPVADQPTSMKLSRRLFRAKCYYEEIKEHINASDIIDQIDAAIDLIYFGLGTLVELGIEPDPYFDIVHKKNMEKLGKDGKPMHNGDGKVIKPEGWVGPESEMRALLQKQLSLREQKE